MKMFKTKEFAEAIGCSYRTVQDWRITHKGRPPCLLPARYENKGRVAIYSEEQIPLALALLGKKDSDDSGNLFVGLVDTTATDVPVVEETANETDGSEEDDFADALPALVLNADDSDDDSELIDPPADGEDLQDARAVFSVALTNDTVAVYAPVVDKPVEPARRGINLIAMGWNDVEAKMPDSSENVDFDDTDFADLEDELPADVPNEAIDDVQGEPPAISQPFVADDVPADDTITDVPDAPTAAAQIKDLDGSEAVDDADKRKADVHVAGKEFFPMAITPNFDAIPQGMKELRRWLCWQLRLKDKPKKPNEKTKIPMTPKNGRLVFADVTKPENWLTFDEAISFYKRGLCTGIGFALTNKTPKLCCVDVDHCFNPDGSLTDEANAVIALCGNSFVEKSQSGDGVHVWFVDEEFPGDRGRKRGGVEVYAFDRYIAITGVRVETSSEELLTVNGACRNVIAKFIDADVDKPSLFDKPARAADDKTATTFTVDANAPLSDDDRRLVEFLRSDKCKDRDLNIFNLFSGNIAEYFKAQGKPVDDSVADCDLMIKLLYYVGGAGSDADIGQRALKVFGQSALAKRGKWLDREDYRLRTLDAAFGIWVNGGRKAGKSVTTDTAAQIDKLKADLRDVAQKLDDFDKQKDAALKRLGEFETFDSDTVFADDFVEAGAFARLDDRQAYSDLKLAIKKYGNKHKDKKVSVNDWIAVVRDKAEQLEKNRSDLAARATALQAEINSAEFVAADDDLRGVKFPDNYAVSRNGIWLVSGESLIPVSNKPVLVVGKAYDVDAQKYKLILSYMTKDGRWKRLPAQEAATVFDARKIVNLSNDWLPVTSSNAKSLIDYLYDFLDANETVLPITYTVGRGGWYEFGGKEIFIDPRRVNVVTDNGKKVSVVVDSNSQFANALRYKGTLEEWKRAYDLAKSSPVARLMVAASVAAPLLKVLGERIFLLYVFCPTRSGKTTGLLLGATAVGSEEIIRSFDGTENGLIGAAAEVNDYVFAIDEKESANPRLKEQIIKFVYSVGNGVGKTRLNRNTDLRDLKRWRLVAIMTGETQMLDDFATDGAKTRLLSIAAPKDFLPADTCKTIRHIVADNYGHAFTLVVDKFIEHKENLRGWFDDIADAYREAYPDILDEYRRYMAVLTLADGLLNSALGVEKALPDATRWAKSVFPLIPTAAEIDGTALEKNFVIGFIAQNVSCFIGKEKNADFMPKPLYGLLNDKDGYSYIIAAALRDACKNAGHDYRKFVDDLVAIGFFAPSDKIKKGHKSPTKTVQKKIGKLNPECYRIPNEALNSGD